MLIIYKSLKSKNLDTIISEMALFGIILLFFHFKAMIPLSSNVEIMNTALIDGEIRKVRLMKNSKLDEKTKLCLQPAHALWKLYNPSKAKYAFNAKTAAQAKQWQKRARVALRDKLGFDDLPTVSPQPRTLARVDRGDFIREKVLIRTTSHTVMPVYILLPKKAARPLPVVLALHGHGYGAKDIVGLWEEGGERYDDRDSEYHSDFAIALCRRGFAVAAPEISCFGERQTDFSSVNTTINQKIPSSCAHTSFMAFYLGGSALGLRVHDARCLINYLEKRKEMDTDRLGAMGISGGGMHTFFFTCIEDRIKACVISGYYSSFRDSIFAMDHCPCNYVPGLHEMGEMSDIIGMIAPRPILIEAGTKDHGFPIEAVRKSVTRAKGIYKIFGAEGNIEKDYFEGRHRICGNRAYDFLMEKLS